MSDATPMPTPSSEQLAEWRALVERIRQGDRSDVVAWDEVAAARTVATYRVLVTQQVRRRLRDAPPTLAGSVAGIIAVLRVDPTQASMVFRRRRLGDVGWRVAFGAAQGLLTYGVVQPEQIVVLLDLGWGWVTDQPRRHAGFGWRGLDRGGHRARRASFGRSRRPGSHGVPTRSRPAPPPASNPSRA
jgi:hypothetical protein